ncbi:MAG: phosphate ABC transporter permease PstA [bacterium JZ-2024 1]
MTRHTRSPFHLADRVFPIIGMVCTLIGLLLLGFLIVDVMLDGLPRLSWQFLTSFPSRKPEQAGIYAAWVGTVWVMVLTALAALPIGIATGIYLEEYGNKRHPFISFIELNIANLAGVPSIIYGLLGLGLFVRWLHLGRSVLAGALTLAILVVPIVIVATREAIRAVPPTIREASLAVGATRWQTIRHQVLPAALPGIMTGAILAMSRAIGETAPLITIGALTYVAFLPASPLQTTFPYISLKGLTDPFTVLPIQIFNWTSRPQKGFLVDAAAGIIVLLAITLLLNSVALIVRYRAEKRVRW